MPAGEPVRLAARLAVDAAVWAAVQTATGYAVHRLPDDRLDHDSWLTRPRRFERDGAFYTGRLRIRRWKRWLPEAGAVFPGGFDKGHLGVPGPPHLRRHLIETRRAELGHWLAVLPAPLFRAWNPRWLTLVMWAYAAAVNGPCIAAQRYNRLRLRRVLRRQEEAEATGRRRENGSEDEVAARARSARGTTGTSMP